MEGVIYTKKDKIIKGVKHCFIIPGLCDGCPYEVEEEDEKRCDQKLGDELIDYINNKERYIEYLESVIKSLKNRES